MTISPQEDHGHTLEANVRDIASRLGVADFVYTGQHVSKGQATREASGDGLLLSNGFGAVLQVKSRDPNIARGDSQARVTAWIQANAVKARDQGRGTKRELMRRQRGGDPVVVYPARAIDLAMEDREQYANRISTDTSSWPIIVVLDHPTADGITLPEEEDTFWITFKNWRDIQLRIRSTFGIIRYVKRVINDKIVVPLGNELERYIAVREADKRIALSKRNLVLHLSDVNDFDELGTNLFHDVINKVWYNDGVIPWKSADEYRTIVEFLDAIPPQVQSYVGRWFLKKRAELGTGQQMSSGLAKVANNQLVYACTDLRNWNSHKDWLSEFGCLTTLRHLHALESGAPSTTTTLGIAALEETRGLKKGISYIFILLQGINAAVSIPKDIRAIFEQNYGVYSHAMGNIREVKIGRNIPCPCGSGFKHKRCCGKNK